MSLRRLVAAGRRPNRIHATWVPTEDEAAFRREADPARVTAEAIEILATADAPTARYLGWLLFAYLPPEELAVLAGTVGRMSGVDARIVCALFLIGAAPDAPWLRPCVAEVVSSSQSASRNMGPSLEVLDGYLREPERFRPDVAVRWGGRMFNDGQYFEAHEVWEDVWRVVPDATDYAFFQALINVAVGFKKIGEHNPNGLQRLMARALRLLETVPDSWRGVDVGALRELAEQTRTEAKRWHDGESGPPDTSEFRLPD